MVNVTLILNRMSGDLWINVEGTHVAVVNNVTGVKRTEQDYRPVVLLRRGKKVGMMWEVEEIRERW